MDDWTHDVVVYAKDDLHIHIGCVTCSWRLDLGAHVTPERVIDEARAHRSKG
jgi:hypothetical protein